MVKLLSKPIDAFMFITAGKSVATIKSVKTGKHFTYKIKKLEDKNIKFVSVLFDPSSKRYQYIGTIRENGSFSLTRGSKCDENAISFKAFNWAWEHIRNMSMPSDLEVWHEGKCGKCGRQLTDPESIELGIGPICRKSIYGN